MKQFYSRIPALLLLAALTCGLLAGCGGSGDTQDGGRNVVNVYNWGEYIDTSIFEDFEAETGIRVNYHTFESNEQLYSILKQGGSSYDVIIPSDYMASRLIQEDMLEPLDYSRIPNAALLDPAYTGLEYDPADRYTVPYMWGTVGIIYNTKVVKEDVTSWGVLWDPQYSGQILQFNNSRDAMATALLYLGYSLNTTDEQQLAEAYALLREEKPVLQKYVMDQCYDLLESGEAAIGPYYAGDYLCMIENNPDLAFVIPEEGTNLFVDCMCIPKGCQNKENAQRFIDFMCRTDIALRNMEETGYSTPNAEAEALFKEDYDPADPEDLYELQIMYPPDTSGYEVYINLPERTLNLYNQYWTMLKS